MNTTNTTQEVIYYVRVSTNNPSIMLGLAHLGKESPFSVAEGTKIFFTKNWDYRLANGNLIALNITVVDEDKEAKENVLVLGGESNEPYVEGLTRVKRLTINHSPDLLKILNDELSGLDYFKHATLFSTPTQQREYQEESPKFIECDSRAEKVSVLNQHLDDLIAQANILKHATDPLVRADAFARLDFSMDRLHRVESTQYGNIMRRASIDDIRELNSRNQNRRHERSYRNEHRQTRPDVDTVYRESTDSFYTLTGEFIETREQRDARTWGHDRPAAQFWEQDRDERDRRR